MGFEYGHEYGPHTYVPPPECASAFTEELRAEAVKKLGGRDYVVRYLEGGERSKHRLPRGTALFGCCEEIHELSRYAGVRNVRVFFSMDCHAPKGRKIVDNVPYRDVIEFYFWENAPKARPAAEAPRKSVMEKIRGNTAAILTVLGGVLAAGTLIAPHVDIQGAVSATRKKFQDAYDFVDGVDRSTEPVWRQQPNHPPAPPITDPWKALPR